MPRENGVHLIHVRLNHNHVPGSPFRVMVGMGDSDPSKVRAYGDGLFKGITGEYGGGGSYSQNSCKILNYGQFIEKHTTDLIFLNIIYIYINKILLFLFRCTM